MTSTVPFPWDGLLILGSMIFTPLAAIYWLVGKNKFFRGFCKLWSITFVLGCIILAFANNIAQAMVVIIGIIVLWLVVSFFKGVFFEEKYQVILDQYGNPRRDETGKLILIKPGERPDLPKVEGECTAPLYEGEDDYDDYDGGYEEPSYSAPKRKSNFGMWYDVNEPTEHKPFPERKPAAPPPPRPEPVRQKSYKVQRMDRGGYWSTKYSTNNLRIAEQQMRSYMNGAYRLQDERQANVRWRIVDEDGRMVL